MASSAHYFKLGLFVLAGTAIAVAAVLALGAGRLFARTIPAETYFDESVRSLRVGAQVSFRGVEVGRVGDIGFVREILPEDHPERLRLGRYVLVRMELDPGAFEEMSREPVEPALQRMVEAGLRVRLSTKVLSDATSLELDYVKPEDYTPLEIDWEPTSHYVPSAPSVITELSDSLEMVFDQISDVDLQRFVSRAEHFLTASARAVEEARVGELSGELLALLEGLRETSESLRRLVGGTPGAAAEGAAGAGENRTLPDMVAELGSASRSLRAAAEEVRSLFGDERLDLALDELAAASPELRRAAADLPDAVLLLSASLERLDRLLSGRRADVDLLFENLRAISENLRYVSESARAFPAGVLFGQPPPPAGERR